MTDLGIKAGRLRRLGREAKGVEPSMVLCGDGAELQACERRDAEFGRLLERGASESVAGTVSGCEREGHARDLHSVVDKGWKDLLASDGPSVRRRGEGRGGEEEEGKCSVHAMREIEPAEMR